MGAERGHGSAYQIKMVCLDELVGPDDLNRRLDEIIDWRFAHEAPPLLYAGSVVRPSVDLIVLLNPERFVKAAPRPLELPEAVWNLGSQWIHIAGVMRILARGNSAYVLAERLATVRVGNPRWNANNGNQLYLGMKHLQLMSELLQLGYRLETFTYYLEDRCRTNRRDIRALRADGDSHAPLLSWAPRILVH